MTARGGSEADRRVDCPISHLLSDGLSDVVLSRLANPVPDFGRASSPGRFRLDRWSPGAGGDYPPTGAPHRDPSIILDFEKGYEWIGLPSLLLQVVTGLLLAYHWLPEISAWFTLDSNVSVYVVTKLALLTATLGLALNAQFRVIPNINRDNMHVLASHIILVTIMSIGFLLAGVGIRTGGLF